MSFFYSFVKLRFAVSCLSSAFDFWSPVLCDVRLLLFLYYGFRTFLYCNLILNFIVIVFFLYVSVLRSIVRHKSTHQVKLVTCSRRVVDIFFLQLGSINSFTLLNKKNKFNDRYVF